VSDKHLYGFPEDESLSDDVAEVAEQAWDDGREPPLEIYEWTSAPMRSFAKVGPMLDHLIEYQLEDYHDEFGNSSDFLEERAEDPAVVAAFEAALDLLFEGMKWRWADKHVATWTVTWTPDDNSDRAPVPFTYERKEVKR
jgi:hypothetical protein